MPEGDTLRRLATRISERFAGETCQKSIMRDPRMIGADFADARLLAADAYGKHLFLRFNNGTTLHSHLLMHGSWQVGRRAQVPEWKRRVELRMETGWLTAIEVPLLGTLPTSSEAQITAHLGPDLCGDDQPDVDLITARIQRDPAAALATAMLDQRNVAGFGNVFAVEVPFIAGVSPYGSVGDIERLDLLVAAGVALIRTSVVRGHRNTTGRRLHTTNLWVYGTAKHPCPICSTTLRGATESETPWQRVTVWCPRCQPSDGPITVDAARIRRALALSPARRESAMERLRA